MTGTRSVSDTHEVFGIPTVLTEVERVELVGLLSALWEATYGQPVADLEEDLSRCRAYFDPTVRGHKLRERLGLLRSAPSDARKAMRIASPQVVIEAGLGRLIVGVEARLLLDMLATNPDASDGHVVISRKAIRDAEQKALSVYRGWCRRRLEEVVALQVGRGTEVLQAIAVGVVLALLVNRSTSAKRAIVLPSDDQTRDEISVAVFKSAERFAEIVSSGRGRSASEFRFRGGYGVSEARRRLAHRLVVVKSQGDSDERIYIPESLRSDVVSFIGRDLARRVSLTREALASGYDSLVDAYRTHATVLANRSLVFERAADTDALRNELISVFDHARGTKGK